MRAVRLTSAFVIALVLAASAAASAPAAENHPLRLAQFPSKFPARAYRLTLPPGSKVSADGIRVFENGLPIDDVAVTPPSRVTNVNIGTVLVIDASNSMRGRPIEAAMEAARAFVAQRYSNQAIAVVTFNSNVRVRLPFTTDEAKIARALSTPPQLMPETHLYDGIDRALTMIDRSGKSASSVVVLSDGADTGSSALPDALGKAASKQHVRVFTVGLNSAQFDPEPLRELATATRASYSQATSASDLAQIYEQLGYSLANEYVIEYRSFARPNERVNVRVSVDGIKEDALATYRAPKLPQFTIEPPTYRKSIFATVIESPLTMLILIVLIAALFAFASLVAIQPKSTGLQARLGAFVAVAGTGSGKRQTSVLSEKLLEGTERSLNSRRWWARFKEELRVAEISMPPEQIIILTGIATILSLWIVSVLMSAIFALLALLIPFLVRMYIRIRADRQRRAFGEQLPDNLQVLSAALRAGHSLIGALSVVVDDAPEPSRREFRQVVADEQLGVPLEDALTAVAVRMRNRDLEQVALVASLQRETGGNSAEVLDRVAETVRERASLRRLVRTLTAQGRMARWIVSSLPLALLVVISILNPEYMKPMFTKTAGQLLLALAAAMVISGSLVIRRIINVRV